MSKLNDIDQANEMIEDLKEEIAELTDENDNLKDEILIYQGALKKIIDIADKYL